MRTTSTISFPVVQRLPSNGRIFGRSWATDLQRSCLLLPAPYLWCTFGRTDSRGPIWSPLSYPLKYAAFQVPTPRLCCSFFHAPPQTPVLRGPIAVYDPDALKKLVKDKALKFGDFTLVSGKKATYYLDGKQVTLDATGARLVGAGILERITDPLPDAVGGMSIGADPITAAILTLAGTRDLPLKGFMVRKEAKEHGLKRYIEGPVASGDRVVIVEDVVTTGRSSLLAIERAESFGLIVQGVVAIIDRLEGGENAFREKGIPFQSLLTIRDFGIEPAVATD